MTKGVIHSKPCNQDSHPKGENLSCCRSPKPCNLGGWTIGRQHKRKALTKLFAYPIGYLGIIRATNMSFTTYFTTEKKCTTTKFSSNSKSRKFNVTKGVIPLSTAIRTRIPRGKTSPVIGAISPAIFEVGQWSEGLSKKLEPNQFSGESPCWRKAALKLGPWQTQSAFFRNPFFGRGRSFNECYQ